ncbi:MAG: DUF1385 domain-containing protein [Acutalibacteraceae bacterium]|jgi:uncharacterized protein YqhQ
MPQECPIQKKTSIGGQALIEGVMMRGPEKTAMAVRHTSGKIVMEEFPTKQTTVAIAKWPLIRGVVNMIGSMALGYKCLMRSAELAGLEEEEDPDKKPGKAEQVFVSLLMVLSTLLGVALAVFLFIFLPAWLYSLITKAFPAMENRVLRSVFEGVMRIALFIGYMLIVSLMKDIKRVFRYHGAEHKAIFCYEAGEELTVENVRKQSRFHPRCGTSFMILMLLVGIVVSIFIPVTNPFLRTPIKILTIPLMVGIGYELIKWAGRSNSWLSRAVSKPGMWMQHITTKEPDDGMIECAIASLKAVIPDDPEADRW